MSVSNSIRGMDALRDAGLNLDDLPDPAVIERMIAGRTRASVQRSGRPS